VALKASWTRAAEAGLIKASMEGTPVITVMRVAYDVEGRPVEMTDTVKSAPSYVLEYSFPAT